MYRTIHKAAAANGKSFARIKGDMQTTSPLTPPGNQIFLRIPETMQDYIEVGGEKKLRLYTPAYNTEDHCATRAEVIAIGPDCALAVKVGDQVAISYQVVGSGRNNPAGYREYDRALQYNGEIFWRAFENDLIARITNNGYEALGDHIVMTPPPAVRPDSVNAHLQEIAASPEAQKIAAAYTRSGHAIGLDVSFPEITPQNCGVYQSGNLEGAQPGDLLYFDDRYCSKYDMPDRTKLWFIEGDFIDGITPAGIPSNKQAAEPHEAV